LAWWLAEHEVAKDEVPVLQTHPPHSVYTETPVGNLALVVDNTLVFSPLDFVLDGITVKVVRELCAGLNIAVADAPLDEFLRNRATEVLHMGTGFGVAGVAQWDGHQLPWPGLFTRKILKAWNEMVMGSLHTHV
jgi:branched-subunit amino acid aminotransferase/4-amino-4-deoxychorismate lyase